MGRVQRTLLGFFALIVFGMLREATYAQTSKPTQPTQQPQVQSLLEQIKSTVVFLQAPYLRVETRVDNGVRQTRQVPDALLGTAFLISVQEPRLGEGQGILYLVTNKHMIRAPGPDGKIAEGPYLDKVYARINTKQVMPGGSQSGIIDMTVVDAMGSLEWFISNDETVDLAITPISLDSNQLDFKTIQTDLFATKDVLAKERISENDEILFTGLFAWSPGAKKNLPIVRHGKIARLFQEPIPLDRNQPDKTVDVHLAEVMSLGGNSGSPVFLRLSGLREESGNVLTTGYRYYLLGVMKGFFSEGMDFVIQVAELHGSASQNSGLAAVVPCDKISEILDSPRSRAYKDALAAHAMEARGNLSDAERIYKEAIQLLMDSSPRHSDLAAFLEAYSHLLTTMKRDKEAREVAKRAAQLRTNVNSDRMNPTF